MWLPQPLDLDVAQSVEQLRHSDDVRHVALMPDVHLAKDVCVGCVVATETFIYPAAVGSDIGCGMISAAFHAGEDVIDNEKAAANVLAALYESVPSNKHRQPRVLPGKFAEFELNDPRLRKIACRDGREQFGTLGRGNHFLEFQGDQEGRLWITIHSGSRAVGQAVAEHYLTDAPRAQSGLRYLHCEDGSEHLYLADHRWARLYASENRLAMLTTVADLMQRLFAIDCDWNSLIHCDHNHVQLESHFGKVLWVHRKGAQSAGDGEPGIIPGSMGTPSFHTLGRGCAEALMSCSHGAGRKLSRTEARQAVGGKEFARQLGTVWYDHRHVSQLRDEAPAAYKDIRQVMKAQRELTRIMRELRPLLSYKGA